MVRFFINILINNEITFIIKENPSTTMSRRSALTTLKMTLQFQNDIEKLLSKVIQAGFPIIAVVRFLFNILINNEITFINKENPILTMMRRPLSWS
jgi:hypothetical protein